MDTLDDAYERMLSTGPEFGGFLSNHGPMVAEVLAHHGYHDEIHRWLDQYERRLEPRPRGGRRITDWQASLGDATRLGDWLDHFEHEVADEPWRAVLARWWPRLLPGIAAAATHGVIRVGHVVRALQDHDTDARRRELGAALASWAARYVLVPTSRPAGVLGATDALAGVPRVSDQSGGVEQRLDQLGSTEGWHEALRSLRDAGTHAAVMDRTGDVVVAAARRYLTHGHGQGIMLVHAVTAPTAVLRVVPELPDGHGEASADLAWIASAALHAAYAPASAWDGSPRSLDAGELLAEAITHGDEHVIKLADAVVDAYASSGDPLLLAAGARSLDLIASNVTV